MAITIPINANNKLTMMLKPLNNKAYETTNGAKMNRKMMMLYKIFW